jgi:hypothetical protein
MHHPSCSARLLSDLCRMHHPSCSASRVCRMHHPSCSATHLTHSGLSASAQPLRRPFAGSCCRCARASPRASSRSAASNTLSVLCCSAAIVYVSARLHRATRVTSVEPTATLSALGVLTVHLSPRWGGSLAQCPAPERWLLGPLSHPMPLGYPPTTRRTLS